MGEEAGINWKDGMKGRLDFHVHSDTGVRWQVSSPHVPGLLTSAFTIPDALEAAAKEIRNLALAAAIEISEGDAVKPIFRPAKP